MRVCVYKNLNRGDWTVAEVSGRTGRGRKLRGVASIALANVVFVVQPAAQAKVAAGAARSVHAWAVGDVIGYGFHPQGTYAEISYNPKRCARFHFRSDGFGIDRASMVEFAADGRAYVVNGH